MHENAFHYFGGVPNAIVPDNLKSAVDTNDDFGGLELWERLFFPVRGANPKTLRTFGIFKMTDLKFIIEVVLSFSFKGA